MGSILQIRTRSLCTAWIQKPISACSSANICYWERIALILSFVLMRMQGYHKSPLFCRLQSAQLPKVPLPFMCLLGSWDFRFVTCSSAGNRGKKTGNNVGKCLYCFPSQRCVPETWARLTHSYKKNNGMGRKQTNHSNTSSLLLRHFRGNLLRQGKGGVRFS